MWAATYFEYGGPDQVRLTEMPQPRLKPEDLLVRVAAVSLNASDIEFLRGKPAYTRAWGLLRPKHSVLGSDVAGIVERVGEKVTRFAPGDRVFGDLFEFWGGLAEFVAAPERLWAPVPAGLTLETACAIPQAGVVAWQALNASGSPRGKRVLIVGAGGGSGTFAVQIAKLQGAAKVTAVDRAAKSRALIALGASEVSSVEEDNYWERRENFDLIVDLVGSRPLTDNLHCLAPGGTYYLVGGSVRRLLGAALGGPPRSLFSSKRARMLVVKQSPQAFTEMAQRCLAGEITPQIGGRYELKRVQGALNDLCEGRVFGKVVVGVAAGGEPHESAGRVPGRAN